MARKPKPLHPRERAAILAQHEQEAIEARRVGLMHEATADLVRREDILERLKARAEVVIGDLLEDDPRMPGRFRLKALSAMTREQQRAIRKIKIRDTIDGQQAEIELYDQTKVEELLGQYVGLWKAAEQHTHNHLHLESQSLAGVPTDVLEAKLRALTCVDGTVVETHAGLDGNSPGETP